MERLPTAAFQAPVKECDDTRKLERDKVENLGRCNALVTEGEETALVATTNLLSIRRGFVHPRGKAHGERRRSRRKALAVAAKPPQTPLVTKRITHFDFFTLTSLSFESENRVFEGKKEAC